MSNIDATDSARELAEEHGIDLSSVSGSGEGGRIVKADVEAKVGGDGPAADGAFEESAGVTSANLGRANPRSFKALAEKLPEKDPVQEAYKEQMLADEQSDEAAAKVTIVEESPDAAETPSGAALLKTAHIADDTERGEAYAREKAAVRHGYARPEDR